MLKHISLSHLKRVGQRVPNFITEPGLQPELKKQRRKHRHNNRRNNSNTDKETCKFVM